MINWEKLAASPSRRLRVEEFVRNNFSPAHQRATEMLPEITKLYERKFGDHPVSEFIYTLAAILGLVLVIGSSRQRDREDMLIAANQIVQLSFEFEHWRKT